MMDLPAPPAWLPDEPTPCYGIPHLFESSDLDDHHAARAHCATCPARVACLSFAHDELRGDGLPTGTWGGVLFTEKGAPSKRVAA